MFCTKCGKELYEGDKFCAHCGAEVREPKRARYDDVVFNPPFKIEAEKRTDEILKNSETPKPAEPKRETVDFNWNLEGFPSSQPRKTEDVDFNWDSVIERRNNSRSQNDERPPVEPEPEEEPISIEELEKELFGDSDKEKKPAESFEKMAGDEKFYTYNQKVDAFQELLKKEKEKLQNMEDSYNEERESLDYTWVGEVFPDLKNSSKEHVEPQQTDASLQFVDVAMPPVTMAVDLSNIAQDDMAQDAEGNSEPEKQESDGADEAPSPSKTKLRYSDIFPRNLVDDGSPGTDAPAEKKQEVSSGKGDSNIHYNPEEDEEPEKKHIFAKIVITILIILIIIEGGIIAIKFIAPESRISLWANETMLKVIDLISGKDGDEKGDDTAAPSADQDDVHMAGLVSEASGDMKTIGEAVYSPDLKYSLLKDYSFKEISSAEEFTDSDWYEDESGNAVTYGQKLTEALINYYDGWRSSNKDKSLIGINKLEIGEIRTGTDGYYVLCRVTYAGADGKDAVKYQTACLKISGDAMIINEIKEENL